jgi:cation diffusion facilitator CzcD-associated flavoprotein CzcO
LNQPSLAAQERVDTQSEHFDVLIVGAGISGIDAAYHLRQTCPDKTLAVLENQAGFGGTWLTHKYPGVRSDSDLFTFGYSWKPWTGVPIAAADEILNYLDETLDEHELRQFIRYEHAVKRAQWDSKDQLWTVDVAVKGGSTLKRFTANFLWMCQGYYRHEEGYTPQWTDMDKFSGPILHPQSWPEDLDYAGKNVLVIGSGATAATLVPAMAKDCAHITMLQRSPTYFAPAPNRNDLADTLRELDVPPEWTHEIVRRKILADQQEITRRSFEEPEELKAELIGAAKEYLGDDYDVQKHFTPAYRPWRQRLAFIPDGDLFQGIREGKASVVTDEIDCFTETGVKLKSGQVLEADIIVTATGFDISILGEIDFAIDGEPLSFADSWTYRGVMYSGIPNMAWVFGYFRASWTLRADLISDFVCRLLQHMEANDKTVVTPKLRTQDHNMPSLPFVDSDNFNPGYLQRSMHLLPKQGDHEPWVFKQDYYSERHELPAADLDDGALVYQ